MKRISQREARRLRCRVAALEAEREQRRNDYPGGWHIGSLTRHRDWFMGRIEAARLLRCTIVVTEESNKLKFYAIK